MSAFIADPFVDQNLIRTRQAQGLDRWDEVWEGAYIVMPSPDDVHQDVLDGLIEILRPFVRQRGFGTIRSTVNVSDRVDDWKANFRIPDLAFFAADSEAENHTRFWCGGPDLAVEIISPDDRSREKLDFYEAIGTREVLLIDRSPWQLELYRLGDGGMSPVGICSLQTAVPLASEVLPLTWRLIDGDPRPQIEIVGGDGEDRWLV